MPRQDDSTISGDIVLYRRVPPRADRVTWGEDGFPNPSSFNFKDAHDELSLHMAQETSPEAVLAGLEHQGFGLVYFTAQQVREICTKPGGPPIIFCRDDIDPTNGHVLLCGKISGAMAKKLSKAARWVEGRWPARIE